MKTTYTFTVLRYVHDITTGEFANVGVALYAPEAKYLSAMCTTRFGRLSKMFLDVNGDQFRSLMRFIEGRFGEFAERVRGELPLEGLPKSVTEIAQAILPADDSSLQWSEPGGGITADPAQTLEQLYVRMVERYEKRSADDRRNDDEIWREFRKEFEAKHVLGHLKPKKIIAKNYEYEFNHSRQNEIWHVYEPLSFDLQETESLLDKANRWFGRVYNLQDSKDHFKIYMLLGEPQLEKLKSTYVKAQNILHQMPVAHEFISEREARKFSRDLAEEITKHEAEEAAKKK